jgi:ATP-dependent Lon protease
VSQLIKYKPEIHLQPALIPYDNDSGHLADWLVLLSDTKFENQLACLLELNCRKRLHLAYEVIVKDGYEAQLETEISEQVAVNIKDAHREIFLRGQLKVILEQLGESAPINLQDSIFRGQRFKVDPGLLFVLMPFADEFRPIFSEIINQWPNSSGLRVFVLMISTVLT